MLTPRLVVWAFSVAMMVPGTGVVSGQNYPTKPIRAVVPAAPGGASEVLARTIGQKLTESWAQQVVVDIRAGGQGIIGSQIVANSAPDGYTILIVATGYAVNPSLYRLPYDTLRDFERITVLATSPNVLVVHPSVPARSVKELIALAKAKPGQLNYASSGVGGGGHLSIELFKWMAELDIVHVPYKGGGEATGAVVAGQVHLLSTSTGAAMPQVRAGRLRALAVTSAKRSPEFQDLPTVAESGLPGYDVTSWFGVLAPGGTPRNIVYKLRDEIARILKLPDVRSRLASLGFEPVGSTPEEFTALVRSELAKWGQAIKAAGIKSEFAP